MKILHIQDAWEIPQFVKELAENIGSSKHGLVLTDATSAFADDSFHFIISDLKLSPEEVNLVVKGYLAQEDDEE